MSENSKKPQFTSVAELLHVANANQWKFKESLLVLKWQLAVASCKRKTLLEAVISILDSVEQFRISAPNMAPDLKDRVDAFEARFKMLGAVMVCGTVTSGDWLN